MEKAREKLLITVFINPINLEMAKKKYRNRSRKKNLKIQLNIISL